MKFEITATITTSSQVRGTINVTKNDVVASGLCKSVEDGDSTAWYSYVGDFLESEFASSEYGYHASDIEIDEDEDLAKKGLPLFTIEDATDIEIDW
jgi:hypothetical protein|tara:strand:+ start:6833 stop:7120 length:288 start_codon:yes stop_codon:yes gene_type:complete